MCIRDRSGIDPIIVFHRKIAALCTHTHITAGIVEKLVERFILCKTLSALHNNNNRSSQCRYSQENVQLFYHITEENRETKKKSRHEANLRKDEGEETTFSSL